MSVGVLSPEFDYRTQCEPVRARFAKLRSREVALSVEGLGKVFRAPDEIGRAHV